MTGQAAERDRSPHNLSVKTTLEEEIERAESILSRWQQLWNHGMYFCLRGLYERSKACFYLPGCRLSAMTHPQSCRGSLLLTPMEETPETLFRGAERSQGKVTTRVTSASCTKPCKLISLAFLKTVQNCLFRQTDAESVFFLNVTVQIPADKVSHDIIVCCMYHLKHLHTTSKEVFWFILLFCSWFTLLSLPGSLRKDTNYLLKN